MAEKPLKEQVALVTGGSKRIGRAIALRLADAGARVAVHYHLSSADAQEVVDEVERRGTQGVAVRADISHMEELPRLVETVEAKLGPVDILVNNAGIFGAAEWDKVSEDFWDRFQNVNLKAQFFLAQAAAPGMKKRGRGRIVNLASMGGMRAWPSFIPYCVSKAGAIMLTRCLARALAPEVTVNAVAPGTIQFSGETIDENYIRRAPLHRTGSGDDIAKAVLYFCTQAEFVTGQVLLVDGGYSLT